MSSPHDHSNELRSDQPEETVEAVRLSPIAGTGRPAEAGPRQIGPYTIKRAIASGGMGVVYEAVQDHPRRSVALKIMRQGLASRSALRRFEFESQILGRLRHACIAQVYDAGVHDEDGSQSVPYFVMEYIPSAKTLTEYAQMRHLPTRERLELFSKVCDGVHHGHQKGVIHRDLKPGNVLVDSSGQPKIIDFGVARATDSDMAVTTLQTDVGQLVGTLQYMSPEQIEADPNDLDVRSDVYSLGVVLYELLTGRLPYDVSNTPVIHATRIIREQAPQRLSTIDHDLRGDVETIALKALQKEREARYQSAMELAQDIRRYLNDEPISARPPSLIYQIRIFARRNKAAFAAIVAVVAVSVAAAIVSTVFARQAIVARDAMDVALKRAQQEADANKAAGDFMRDVLALASPQRAMGKQITVREALDIAAANITAATSGQPLAEASARVAVGSTYRTLGMYAEAHDQLSRALDIRKRERGPGDQQTLATITELASVLGDMNRGPEAIAMMTDNLAAQTRLLGPNNLDTVRTTNALAWALYSSGDYAESERLFRKSLDGFTKTLGPDAGATIKAKTNIAMTLASQFRAAEAEPLAREAATASERVLGPKNPDTLYAKNTLAWTLLAGQKASEAEPIWKQVVADATDVMGVDHPYRLYWLNSLAWCLLEQDKAADALPMFLECATRREQVLAEGHPDTFNSYVGYLRALSMLHQFADAEPIALKWRDKAANRFGEHSRMVKDFSSVIVDIYTGLGRPDDAAKYRTTSDAP